MGRGKPKAVECIDTGKRFVSATEAANAMGVNQSSICDAVKRGSICCGMRWKYVNNEDFSSIRGEIVRVRLTRKEKAALEKACFRRLISLSEMVVRMIHSLPEYKELQ